MRPAFLRPRLGHRLLLAVLVSIAFRSASSSDLSSGARALQEGRIAEALTLLHAALRQQDRPATRLLLCRAYYAESQYEQAAPECTAALSAPTSEAYLWQARVTGERARTKNPLSAFSLARDTRSAFEQAVRMNPANLDAVSDLGEFYVSAPSIVGGGLDKARALAAAVLPRSPRMSHTLLAWVAAKSGNTAEAERELRQAIAAATPAELPASWIDLGRSFRRSHQTDAAEQAALTAIAKDDRLDGSLVDAAKLLYRLRRNSAAAEQALRIYCNSAARSDDAPAFKAHALLASLLASAGDQHGAAEERAIAHTMAPDWVQPSREGSPEQVP